MIVQHSKIIFVSHFIPHSGYLIIVGSSKTFAWQKNVKWRRVKRFISNIECNESVIIQTLHTAQFCVNEFLYYSVCIGWLPSKTLKCSKFSNFPIINFNIHNIFGSMVCLILSYFHTTRPMESPEDLCATQIIMKSHFVNYYVWIGFKCFAIKETSWLMTCILIR